MMFMTKEDDNYNDNDNDDNHKDDDDNYDDDDDNCDDDDDNCDDDGGDDDQSSYSHQSAGRLVRFWTILPPAQHWTQ